MVYKAELEHFDGINSLVVEGKVKGELCKKCSTVAIKRIFSREDEQGRQGFFAEIEMLSNCKHPNIVSLLGFCDEGPEMLLVYEYASNGSLDDYLGNIDNMTYLTWAQRVQICLDIAHGLNYLHRSTARKQSIIHRDIKSANILLDDNWVAKIADFGLSKLHPACQQGSTLITYNIAGTDVYLDPEYLKTGKLKTKSDIYSFGVVMLEIMCGKLAYDKTFNEEGLPSVARLCFNERTLEKLVDPNLKETDEIISMLNGGVNQDSLDTFSKIAHQCLAVTIRASNIGSHHQRT
ncbi:receptor-like protein kinase ANXUR2 [Bidens hawaiensis]|uniref:receptor-like protein kinase ANXUR2 n=1 Tax=Bidens hawaiensis TaxID=980011 RepID=UPI004049FD6F